LIRAVARALSVLDAFDRDHPELTLQDISERIKMPKATTFRLVNTLERAGFLVRMENQRYCLSFKFLALASLVRGNLEIREFARPIMREISERTGETITLNRRAGTHRICLEAIDTPSPLMSIARPGEMTSLLYGATSRILLAFMDERERSEVLSKLNADNSVDLPTLQRELERFRRQGYALTRGQRVMGITAISVPLFGLNNEVQHCLALTGPSVRVDPKDTEFVDIMIEAGTRISRQLGAISTNDLDLSVVENSVAKTGHKRKGARAKAR
jgi:DNA-binding IclR family transcriptional regulator